MRENGPRARYGDRTRRKSVGKLTILMPNFLQRQCIVTRPPKT